MASGETVHKILLLLARTVYYQHTIIKEHVWVITAGHKLLFHSVLNAPLSALRTLHQQQHSSQ